MAERLDALLGPIEADGDVVGAYVIDGDTGAPIYSWHEHRRALPASTMKVATTAAALAALGPDFRFHTRVTLQGAVKAHVLAGDVVVGASGDPSFGSSRDLTQEDGKPTSAICHQIAEALAAHGIHRWTGNLHIAHPAGVSDPPMGPGWAWDDGVYDYGAAATTFVFRENSVRLEVAREPDERCTESIRWAFDGPTGGLSADVAEEDDDARNSGVDCQHSPRGHALQCIWRHGPDVCPLAASVKLSVPDAAATFAACLEHALKGRHIDWPNSAHHTQGPVDPAAKGELLLDIGSPTLADLVHATNKDSLNLYAERLGLKVAEILAGNATYPSLRKAALADHRARGIDESDIVQVDGSGLSRYNLATPFALARILYTSLKSSYGDALLASLPISGVDGTLARHETSAEVVGHVRAKTGTLTGQRAFVGVIDRPNDPWHPKLVFSLMVGNLARPVATTNAMFDAFTQLLATERLPVPAAQPVAGR